MSQHNYMAGGNCRCRRINFLRLGCFEVGRNRPVVRSNDVPRWLRLPGWKVISPFIAATLVGTYDAVRIDSLGAKSLQSPSELTC